MLRECSESMLTTMTIESVYIEITNRCNLNCRDCYNASGKNTTTVELAPEVLMGFIEELRNRFGVSFINISGGEPLLHSRFNELLKSMSALSNLEKANVDFNFISNGTVNNPLFFALLETTPHFYAQFSLDGPTEAVNASMRGAGSFDKMMRNLAGRKFYNPPVFKMVINKTNAPYIEDHFHLVHDDLGGKPAYSFVTPHGNAVDNWSEMLLSNKERSDIVLKIHKLFKQYNIEGALPLPTSHCDLTEENGKIGACVKWSGSIQPCQILYDDKFSLGNIHSIDWDALFQNVHAIHSKLKSRLACDYGCSKCAIEGSCGRGCPALAEISNGNLLAGDGDCELRRLCTFRLISYKKQ